MSFMNKVLLVVVLLISFIECDAQTYYYKLGKKIVRNQVYTNTAGGQFVTFIGNKCFESDKNGNTVGNGELYYDTYYSGKYNVYLGTSYFGNNVKFKFTQDRNLLNVETSDGRIYVYKRQTPPSSVTTCSLIRKKTNSGSSGGYVDPIYPNNGYSGGYTGGSTVTNTTQRQNGGTGRKQPMRHTCSLCNGKKRIVKDTYPPMYGMQNYQERCNECGGLFWRSTGHTHITCPQCHGKGYFTTD